jgi:hypothetical protein
MFDKFQDIPQKKQKKQKFSYLEWRKKHKKPLDLVRKYGVSIILYGTAIYFVFSFLKVNYESLKFLTKLNYTTHQISNLVENIRTHYMVYDDETETSVERLIEVDAIPQSIISEDNTLVNPYGGSIIIAPSDRLRNVKENIESTTFKMSYQGLPKDVCVNLAMMDWGDKVKGLLAVAIGSYDEKTGVDEALNDIDRKETDVKFSSFTDDKGRKRSIRQRRHYSMNVSKPDDHFLPTPFSRGNAKSGCKCKDNNCTFALRYTVFGVGNSPTQEQRQNESAFSRLRRKRLGI